MINPDCVKKSFTTKKKAKEFIKFIKRKTTKPCTRAYKCKMCQSYHVTTMPVERIVKQKELIASFKIGKIWKINRIEFEITTPPQNAKGLQRLVDNGAQRVN